MFVEWRKLGDAMWGLASLVMLKNDQEASEHGVFWDGDMRVEGACKTSVSSVATLAVKNNKLMGRRHSAHLVAYGTVFLCPNPGDCLCSPT